MNRLNFLSLFFLLITVSFVGCVNNSLENRFPSVENLPIIDTLPDVLTIMNGEKITTVKEWEELRKPELAELFQHYMYGYFPEYNETPKAVVESSTSIFDGKGTLNIVKITPKEGGSSFSMLLVLPTNVEKPSIFIGLNFLGNHTVANFAEIPLPEVWINPEWAESDEPIAMDNQRGLRADEWSLELIVERDYGVATIYAGEISPDYYGVEAEFDGCISGIQKEFLPAERCAPIGSEWGQIAAWAWGIHRGVDYLVDNVEHDKIIVMGHSRLGKAALVAGAYDERIDIVIPSQSGCGGAAPSRTTVGEKLDNINPRFPFWFSETFKGFNDQVEKLPFDQHCLIAIVAPRPLLLTNATDDQWTNPTGQFDMLNEASKVYELYGKQGFNETEFPSEYELIGERMGYFIRPGGHSTTGVEWNIWMDFCEKF